MTNGEEKKERSLIKTPFLIIDQGYTGKGLVV